MKLEAWKKVKQAEARAIEKSEALLAFNTEEPRFYYSDDGKCPCCKSRNITRVLSSGWPGAGRRSWVCLECKWNFSTR